MAAFNLRFQTIVLTGSTLLGMALVPHLVSPLIHQRPLKGWKQMRRLFMASAQLYTQTKMALGLPIHQTDVTRK